METEADSAVTGRESRLRNDWASRAGHAQVMREFASTGPSYAVELATADPNRSGRAWDCRITPFAFARATAVSDRARRIARSVFDKRQETAPALRQSKQKSVTKYQATYDGPHMLILRALARKNPAREFARSSKTKRGNWNQTLILTVGTTSRPPGRRCESYQHRSCLRDERRSDRGHLLHLRRAQVFFLLPCLP
jgi:hypothetical protein